MSKTDYLIIGSGIAGLSLALKLAENFPDREVLICTKKEPSVSNTKYAQGGIAVVSNQEKDSFEKHIQDTLVCGHFLSDRLVTEDVVIHAPQRFQELTDWGFRYDKNESGEVDLGREGGHAASRIIHHKDATGLEIETTLLNRTGEYPNIELRPYHFAVDFLLENGKCTGAILADKEENLEQCIAGVTVVATGGIGQVYGHTTNPEIATGDGIAMASRAGVIIEDMEFIQFHPTALFLKENKTTFLISEAVRGFGGVLKNCRGEKFMKRYDPRGDLAPRDIVSQSIFEEMHQTRSEWVYLDCRHLPEKEFETHFPTITKKCLEKGINVHQQMIPVAPAQHYLCGGIKVDLQGRTSLENLYACGECSKTGLHGANRLASNSLLEALIFADNIFHSILNRAFEVVPEKPADLNIFVKSNLPEVDAANLTAIRKTLNGLMTKYAGIIKNRQQLLFVQNQLKKMYEDVAVIIAETRFSVKSRELVNMIETARLIVGQSLMRQESIGTFQIREGR